MPVFRCNKCGCVENTATGWYWSRNMSSTPERWKEALCSEHGPKFIDGDFSDEEEGEWHGKFDKMSATGWYVDESNFIWQLLDGAPHAYGPIIGKYAEDGSIIPLTPEEKAEHERLNEKAFKMAQAAQAQKTWDEAVAAKSKTKASRPWVSLSNKKSKQKKAKKA